MSQRHYIERFHCDPDLPCYCRSGQAFGACCGSENPERPLPYGVRVVPGFLPIQDCRRLVRYAEKQKGHWLMVRDAKRSRPGKLVEKRDPGRVTQQVDMSKHQLFINDAFRRALVEVAGPAYGAIEFFETPYLLRYRVGGTYGKHADSDGYERETGRWYRSCDRDVSALIYLNDDYEGGELLFNRLHYTYRPQAGDLVLFPSGNLFLHQSVPITRGTKYSLVSWAALKASPKLFPNATKLPPIRI